MVSSSGKKMVQEREAMKVEKTPLTPGTKVLFIALPWLCFFSIMVFFILNIRNVESFSQLGWDLLNQLANSPTSLLKRLFSFEFTIGVGIENPS